MRGPSTYDRRLQGHEQLAEGKKLVGDARRTLPLTQHSEPVVLIIGKLSEVCHILAKLITVLYTALNNNTTREKL